MEDWQYVFSFIVFGTQHVLGAPLLPGEWSPVSVDGLGEGMR